MKTIKKYNDFKLNESFYENFWIDVLKKEFNATVTVDKEKSVKPLYGGGNYTFIGYKVVLNEPSKNLTYFILEGLQINGVFVAPAIIMFKGELGMLHGSLKTTYSFNNKLEDNITMVIEALKEKISKYHTS